MSPDRPGSGRGPGKASRSSLPSTVIALGVVSFLTDMSSEMIYPLLPVFLVSVLGAGAVSLGIIEGIAESTASVLKIVSGRLTDRSGRRKPFVLAGYGLSGLMRPLIGLAAAWPAVAGLRFADRIGKGLRTSPRDALIADVTDPESRGAAYGFHRAMDHGGAVVGPLVAAGLILLGASLRIVFLLAAVPAVIVVFVIWYRVVDSEATSRDEARHSAGLGADLGEMGQDCRRLLLAFVVFALGNSTDAFLLLRFTDAGIAVAWIPVLWSVHHVVKMASTWMGGRLSDRRSRRSLVLAGWAIYAGVYIGFAVTADLTSLIALFMIYGLYFGFTEPVERSWNAAMAPERIRGGAFGLYHGSIGLAALPASVIFGLLYQHTDASVAFGFGAVLAMVAAGLLLRVPDTAHA